MGKTTITPVNERYFYYDSHLQAVRSGKWKLILPRPKCPAWLSDGGKKDQWRGADVEEILQPELYDLVNDVEETTNVANKHEKTVKKLLKLANKVRNDIGDYNQIGTGARFYDEEPKRPDVEQWKDKRLW